MPDYKSSNTVDLTKRRPPFEELNTSENFRRLMEYILHFLIACPIDKHSKLHKDVAPTYIKEF